MLTNEQDKSLITYPSISICKKYSIENDLRLNEPQYDLNKVADNVWLESFHLEDQIYFFTQPGVENMTFPCTTMLGGTTPGRPCVFPIKFDGTLRDKCSLLETSNVACITKVNTENLEEDLMYTPEQHHFGYCSKECAGEMPGPSSPYNLARLNYSEIWDIFYYDLSPYENGYCFTYNPPIEVPPGKIFISICLK